MIAETEPVVAELQGIHGAFSFPERILQKIWLRGDFDRAAARLADGRPLRILGPGRWNLLGGPDFRQARLRLGGEGASVIMGDVEVHLRAADWDAHGHARDRAYDDVVLHVVLFPPRAGTATIGAGGRTIPVFSLLPLLHRGLEEYAADDAVEGLADRILARLPEELALTPPEERRRLLEEHAGRRWRQKVHFAGLRLRRLGWEAACHQAAMEILGYRFNRAPMLRLAAAHPLGEWRRSAPDPAALAAEEAGAWSLQGVRPANRPIVRLRQYAAWVARVPTWPDVWRELAGTLPRADDAGTAAEVRRWHGLAAWRERLATDVGGGALGGTRLDTLICDGLLPLAAAAGHTSGQAEVFWRHWFPGDLPPALRKVLVASGVCDGAAHPLSHGAAQGALGWLIERGQR
ncbi:MAG: hypothetical protein RLZZ188_203 [Verrucomicrobiota bacterium]